MPLVMHDLGYDSVDFELDAKSKMDNVNNQQPNVFDFGVITHECNCLLVLFLGTLMLSSLRDKLMRLLML